MEPFEYGADNVRASTPAINLTDKNWIISVTFDPTNPTLATADKRTNRCGAGSIALNSTTGTVYRKKSTGLWVALTDSDSPSLVNGMGMDYWGATAPSGWVFAYGTIGSADSGATNRANADTASLFATLWAATDNVTFPIQDSAGNASVRGATAAADFAANKRFPMPDKRGRCSVGKDDMGGVAAGRMTAASILGTTMGKSGGEETHVLLTAELASHTHTQGNHSHTLPGCRNTPPPNGSYGSGPFTQGMSINQTITTTSDSSGAIGSAGSDTAHNNVQPSIICNYIIKL